ncbi:MAG: CBS domain-containing protein [Bacteroidia bacterium]|nr:CBS domain-containing protein [Bacteroidia bacterium]
MKISASLYSNKGKNLSALVSELDAYKVDSFHIDCKDNPEVFSDIDKIRNISSTAIDLHLITSEPDKFSENISKREIEYVTYQYENINSPIHFPKNGKTEFGMAITSDTPLEVFSKFSEDCSFILMMTTTPGESGGTFNKKNFKRIRDFRKMFPEKRVHVDGGVNDEVSFILRDLGVHKIVSGSYLVNHQRIGAAMLQLKHEEVHSHFQIKDFMINSDQLPVLNIEDATFTSALETIEKYNLGFVFYTDKTGKLCGISSNADVRRGIIKNLQNLNGTSVVDIINEQPLVVRENMTLSEMLQLISSVNFPVLFLPVISDNEKLVGAVTFNNLLRNIT